MPAQSQATVERHRVEGRSRPLYVIRDASGKLFATADGTPVFYSRKYDAEHHADLRNERRERLEEEARAIEALDYDAAGAEVRARYEEVCKELFQLRGCALDAFAQGS